MLDAQRSFTPLDWYWLADDGRVYASARQATVGKTDAGFKAAQETGAVTRWPVDDEGVQTDASLQSVLDTYGLAATLNARKADLKTQIDARAEALRLTLITPGSGQAMEYQEAYSQARAALAAGDGAKPSDYPMLAVTIGVDTDPQTGKPAKDVLGVARSVKAAYEAYLQAGAAIRGARLLGKAEIDATSDAEQARAVFAAIKWPSFG